MAHTSTYYDPVRIPKKHAPVTYAMQSQSTYDLAMVDHSQTPMAGIRNRGRSVSSVRSNGSAKLPLPPLPTTPPTLPPINTSPYVPPSGSSPSYPVPKRQLSYFNIAELTFLSSPQASPNRLVPTPQGSYFSITESSDSGSPSQSSSLSRKMSQSLSRARTYLQPHSQPSARLPTPNHGQLSFELSPDPSISDGSVPVTPQTEQSIGGGRSELMSGGSGESGSPCVSTFLFLIL
jgi:hypothetical protein